MNELRLISLVKTYRGRCVVNEVSLSVSQRQVVGLLGPNGAGKTTTFYMTIGLTRPDSGRVELNNEDIGRLPMYLRARRGIGYLTQEPSIFRKLTVEENIKAILETLPIPQRSHRERLDGILEELGIARVRKQKAFSLSGGERRRVEIARTLVCRPSFILLDEPFAGIDPLAVEDIKEIVFHLKEKDIGILITDHNVRDTLEITDYAYIISEGRILASGTSDEIAASEEVRRFYLGEKFQLLKSAHPANDIQSDDSHVSAKGMP
ncbi:LPS export ABC transporter ATP-binding protein [bacterium]|nr:LPS export ABC transporter ATP-binding protein [candidate division CSSED10-310 bacterium]